ncbi:hypothetical protein TNCV_4454051 [Trichonephila clavipes]|nr:hypothetical protein TNCV_4454051 [Trichonephila clavipes]
MSQFNIPILEFFGTFYLKKRLNFAVGENNSTRAPQLKNQTIAQEKQLNSTTGTKQLNLVAGNLTQFTNMRKQLNSAVGTKQLNSAGGNQLNSAAGVNQLNSVPPSSACTAFTAELAILFY